LRNLAAQKFKAEVAEHWDHEDLAHEIHVIYTSNADEVTQLREVAVEALDAHRGQLLEKPEIATLLRSITGLACDLLLRNSSIATGRRLATTTSNQFYCAAPYPSYTNICTASSVLAVAATCNCVKGAEVWTSIVQRVVRRCEV